MSILHYLGRKIGSGENESLKRQLIMWYYERHIQIKIIGVHKNKIDVTDYLLCTSLVLNAFVLTSKQIL